MRGGYYDEFGSYGQVGIFTREGGKRRRTMRGGDIGVCSPGMTCGGRKRRSMRGGQTYVALQEGGRKRSMRGGQVTSISQFSDGGRKRRTMGGGSRANCIEDICGGRKRRTMRGGVDANWSWLG